MYNSIKLSILCLAFLSLASCRFRSEDSHLRDEEVRQADNLYILQKDFLRGLSNIEFQPLETRNFSPDNECVILNPKEEKNGLQFKQTYSLLHINPENAGKSWLAVLAPSGLVISCVFKNGVRIAESELTPKKQLLPYLAAWFYVDQKNEKESQVQEDEAKKLGPIDSDYLEKARFQASRWREANKK